MPTSLRTRRAGAALAAAALFAALLPASPAFAGGGLFVTFNVTNPVSGTQATVTATLFDFQMNEVSTVTGTGNSSILLFPDVPAGEYWVSGHATAGSVVWGREFMGGGYTGEGSIPVEIFEGAAFPAPEPLVLERGGSITGDVEVTSDDSNSATIEAYRWDGSEYVYHINTQTVDDEGDYRLDWLPPGDYQLRTIPSNQDVQPEWWLNSVRRAGAVAVSVAAESTQTISPFLGGGRGFAIDRIAGDDRFETSVLISEELFPTGETHAIPVLYIANGLNYPDALSAGPAASHLGGGLLLVAPTSVPDVVLDEIDRLNPAKIVIAGGTPSVSAAVATQLATFAPVERFAGTDRYETSRLIVEDAFGCSGEACQETVFIATGSNFPDALAAGPAAAVRDAPVLLVNGALGGIDPQTANLLEGLDPQKVTILGSTASVSAGIENDFINSEIDVVRFSGVNRYETAALLNAATFRTAERAYVATGLGFADALAGGPLAAAFGAPMVLTPPNCGTNDNYDLLVDLYVVDIVYLGGLPSVGDVAVGQNCGF